MVERFENRAWMDAEVTAGYVPVLDVRQRRMRDVQVLAGLLSFEPVSRRYGYYGAEKRKWYMSADAIVQRLLHEGYAWVDGRKVRDAVMLRKS